MRLGFMMVRIFLIPNMNEIYSILCLLVNLSEISCQGQFPRYCVCDTPSNLRSHVIIITTDGSLVEELYFCSVERTLTYTKVARIHGKGYFNRMQIN